MGDRGHNRHGLKRWGAAMPLSWGPRLVPCGLGRGLLPYQAASSSIQPFGHNRHRPKIRWGGCALFLGVAGSTSNTLRRPPYQVASWCIQPFGHNKDGPKIWGLCPVLGRGAVSPSSTESPGLRPTFVPSGILIHPAVWPQKKWAENCGGGSAPFWGRGLGPHLTQSRRGWGYHHAKYQLHPSSRLAAINMGGKLGGSAPFWGRGAGSPSNTKSSGLKPSSIPSDILNHAAIWPQLMWAENWGGLCPFVGGEAGYPSNTMWPGPMPTACKVSSWSVQPFGHSARTLQTDRQDNGPIA